MNDSFLYHAFGVRGYTYKSLAYKDNAIILRLQHKEQKHCECPHCHSPLKIHYGNRMRQIRSLPIGSKPMFFEIDVPRYKCKHCARVWQADVPFTHGNVSYSFRLSRYVIELLRLGLPIQDVANHLCMSWGTVKEIHKRYLRQHYAHPDIRHTRRIGIDEFATHKGHIYKTIVVDLDTGHIIHTGDGKGKEALTRFWKRVEKYKVHIEVVTSDMSAAYISSVMENAPNATHVYDHFHVVKLMNEAVDQIRRNVYKQETEFEKRKLIKGSRWLLLRKDTDKFDEMEKSRLQNILSTNEPLFKAYYMREDLDMVWQQENKQEAEKQLEYWWRNAQNSGIPILQKVANSIYAYRTGIVAWYDCKTSNAKVEGINNKIKVMKRQAYGYRDDEYFNLRLLGLHDKTNSNLR